jgi:hypothetical protein
MIEVVSLSAFLVALGDLLRFGNLRTVGSRDPGDRLQSVTAGGS